MLLIAPLLLSVSSKRNGKRNGTFESIGSGRDSESLESEYYTTNTLIGWIRCRHQDREAMK